MTFWLLVHNMMKAEVRLLLVFEIEGRLTYSHILSCSQACMSSGSQAVSTASCWCWAVTGGSLEEGDVSSLPLDKGTWWAMGPLPFVLAILLAQRWGSLCWAMQPDTEQASGSEGFCQSHTGCCGGQDWLILNPPCRETVAAGIPQPYWSRLSKSCLEFQKASDSKISYTSYTIYLYMSLLCHTIICLFPRQFECHNLTLGNIFNTHCSV